jgi:diketogulonate reductase-like aldo/keto reductase
MNQKELGTTGVRLSEIGLGTSNYNAGAKTLRRAAVELGAFFIDTAESYDREEVVGEAVRGMRDKFFTATKISPAHFRRTDVRKAADESLRRLKMDYVDLYQLHEPSPTVPIDETMAAMEDLVDAGKVRFIGVSNFSVRQMKGAQRAMRKYPIVSNQVRYSLVERTIERELLPFCQENGITILAFSPLGKGISNIRRKDTGNVLREIAAETGKTAAQVALNWCIAKPGVIALTKSNSFEHLVEDCSASGWRLSEEQLQRLSEGIGYRRRSAGEVFLRRMARRMLERPGYW